MNHKPATAAQSIEAIAARIMLIRAQKVMIDADLVSRYGVPAKALNQPVKRNAGRFPEDFMFQLTAGEKAGGAASSHCNIFIKPSA